ncbi:MAG: hypothetical protein ABRQ39_32935 [Candidatus Eremiobacterota bacterium]
MPFYKLEDLEIEELDDLEKSNSNPKVTILDRNRQALKDFLLWRREKMQKEQVMKLGDLQERT